VTKQTILIRLIHYPLYSLGPGKRIGVWVQGCSIHCKDCISTHTWSFDQQYEQKIDNTVENLADVLKQGNIGMTVSGGEPFDQKESLKQLLKACRSKGFKDILVYSGYNYEYLQANYSDVFPFIDVLIDGNFQSGNRSGYIWKGSDNQRLMILSKDIHIISKYEKYKEFHDVNTSRSIELFTMHSSIFVVGIPKQEDVEVLNETL